LRQNHHTEENHYSSGSKTGEAGLQHLGAFSTALGYYLMIFFTLVLLILSSTGVSQNCTYIVNSESGTTIIDPEHFPDISPGDVLCFREGPFFQILVQDLHGQPGNPIILRNLDKQTIISGKTANYGMSVRNCSFLEILGNGNTEIDYGFYFEEVGAGAGLSLDQLSTDITVARVEVANTALSGIVAKTDPDCSFTSTRDKYTMYNTIIRDNYIHDIGTEGLYIGNSFYNGKLISCGLLDTLVLPHVLEGVQVFNNIIENTGRNGLQVSSAVQNCKIYNNRISFDSQSETPNQMGGIQIGGGSICDCYNNRISEGKGSGIEVFGRGNFMLYNNLIEYPGRSFKPNEPHYDYPKHGIFVKHVNTDPEAKIQIFHNTIIFPKSDGILFVNDSLKGSQIKNNIIINPGSFEQISSDAYVHCDNIELDVSHNFFTLDIDKAYFTDYFLADYHLKPFSPAVDQGEDLSSFGIDFDFQGCQRPLGKGFDIGAFEADPEDKEASSPTVKVFPNPFTDHLSVCFLIKNSAEVSLEIFSVDGKRIFEKNLSNLTPGKHKYDFGFVSLPKGIYLLKVKTMDYTCFQRIVSIN